MGLLEIDRVTIRFGGHTAVNGASLTVEPGSITGLIGPNGAGKTTLFNAVCGLLTPDEGRIRLGGRDITDLKTHKRARLGLARTFQRLEIFTSLTVRENIQVAGEIRNSWNWRHRTSAHRRADQVIELLGLGPVAGMNVAEIPTGQARVVELGRALMTDPSVLLLDEPASGQDDRETEQFGALLTQLVADGRTILLVEHDMTLVMAVCDVINVLDFGEIIAVGAPDEIRRNQHVLDAYLGSEAEGTIS